MMPWHLVILGRQGSGKGTQANRIVNELGTVHVSTGDMLRSAIQARTELGLAAKVVVDSGGLVGDETMCGIVDERLGLDDVIERGVLLDGFPRNLVQAQALVEILGTRRLDAAVNLDVPVDVVTARMLERGRHDDAPEAIAKRLELYESETQPLIEWFEDEGVLVTVDGVGSEEEVFGRIKDGLNAANATAYEVGSSTPQE